MRWFKKKKRDVVNSKKICDNCGRVIKKGENYGAMVIDEDWNASMSGYDLLTGSFRWKTFHNPCPYKKEVKQ